MKRGKHCLLISVYGIDSPFCVQLALRGRFGVAETGRFLAIMLCAESVIFILHHASQPDLPFNPLNPELNPICYLLALLGAHHFLHVSRIRVKSLTFRLLMSYIYGAPILDVSRSHTTTQHGR